MKGDEIELFAQPLLESRTDAYIEWLDNELIMTANNNTNKDSLLVLLSAKRKPTNYKAYHNPLESGNYSHKSDKCCEYIVYSGFIYPYCRYCLRSRRCVKDSSGGHRRILAYYR